jgi:ADP-dependent NAD(P)H-hydrate dehydratase / NAD(P)H-hydrate epimerase
MALPVALYCVAQVREIDARAVAAGTPGYTLMQQAGEAALRVLRERWPAVRRIAVVCGGGNNGGDGYVLARLARAAGLEVSVFAAADPQGLAGDARKAFEDLRASGLGAQPFAPAALPAAEVVVDAFLGIGVRLPLRAAATAVVAAMNHCGRPVLALDVPSGLDADAGVADAAVRAEATVTFVALKTGLFVGDGPSCTGRVYFDALGLAPPACAPRLERLTDAVIAAALPPRPRNAHKASFGRVLIIGGGAGMPGAVRLAAEAALRVGAGLVTVASLPEHLAPILGGRPELMFHALAHPGADPAGLQERLQQADVVAIGPGLGRSDWARALLEQVLRHRPAAQPLVVDADALNLLAERGEGLRSAHWILTPHPGEAARLLGQSAAEVQADRLAALQRLQRQRGGVIVLKGAGTLIASPGQVASLCERGNPGMAIPGMGDVLTGAIAGIVAQCRDAPLGTRAAVLAHATAADALAASGQRGLLAGDVSQALRRAVNP